MARYLFADNYLADIDNVASARINLGLGNMSTMNSNDIQITGGNIIIDSFRLNSTTPLSSSNFFLKNSSAGGSVEWFEIPAIDWLKSDQGIILLSEFSNDAQFVTSNELARVAFSGDWNDVSNTPTNLKDIYYNDILHTFLDKRCNLSDIVDKSSARLNLGLGDLATQSINHVSVSNLTVTNSMTLTSNGSIVTEGYLYVDSNSNLTTINNFPEATSTQSGFVFTCNVNINSSNMTPTSSVLYQLNSNILADIDSLKLNEIAQITNLFSNNFLYKSNFLSEYSNADERLTVRTNLGFGDLATQNSNNVSVSNLTVNNLQFFSGGNPGLLYFDNTGTGILSNLPEATNTTLGVVYTINDYSSYISDAKDNQSVLSLTGFSNYFNSLHIQLTNLQTSIPTNISQLQGGSDFMLRTNNLSDLTNTIDARSNLQLKTVASTGLYSDLVDRPYDISTFHNNVGFLRGDCNLSELTDIVQARRNLGLGSMATQNSNNVSITGGIVSVADLKISKDFLYQSDTNNEGKILICGDSVGTMEWKSLPQASYSTYGAVKITPTIELNDQRTDVVPNCEVFSQIEATLVDHMTVAMNRMKADIYSTVYAEVYAELNNPQV